MGYIDTIAKKIFVAVAKTQWQGCEHAVQQCANLNILIAVNISTGIVI
jgi:hypothetical protein